MYLGVADMDLTPEQKPEQCEDAKKAARAIRFGISNSNTANYSFDALKQRAKEFGVNLPSKITKFNKRKGKKRQQKRFGTQRNQRRTQKRLQKFEQTGSFY